jgi:signal transduction histidine kinase
MTGGSLRLRLLAGTLTWVLVAIAVAGWGLRGLFQEHTLQQLQAQLVTQLDQLTAAVDWGPDGKLSVGPVPGSALLSQPLSGLYWQVDELGRTPQTAARSRSLWDQTLQLPAPPAGYPASGYSRLDLHDAQGHALLAVARIVALPEDGAPPLRLVVAANTALIAEPLQRFTHLLLMALGLLAAGLALAVVLQLQLALRPLDALRRRLAAVRTGDATRLEGQFPQELQPLVGEFNRVLGANADMVEQARAQAGNLAHAVHTPLTILANAAALEDGAFGRLVRDQVESARRQVDYHLAQARAAAAVRATGLATPVLQPLNALLRTMRRLHAARNLIFDLAPDAEEVPFRGEEQDLYELLGNLLDNAGKWARSQVRVDVRRAGDEVCFVVDDDGPGVPEAARDRMFERGVQLDERRAGAGLGLDIVRTLAETYGGRVRVLESPLGGLRMQLWLPAAGAAGG